jgi:ornithine cyclodeaminase/alanine dehydrogenase-like protein (mu-crystallin family)
VSAATLRILDAAAVEAALPWPVAVAALEEAFRTEDPGAVPPRSHLDVPGGELLLMPAHGAVGVGVKLVTLAPGNPGRGLPFIHGAYVLFSPGSLVPEALLDGTALTTIRTAAVSALATDRLAPPDASRLVVFGAGAQARSHALAMAAVRPIESVRIVGRDRGRAAALVDDLRAAGLDATVAGPEAVADADLVCTCTTSRTPVFDGAALAPDAHVNAIGAYRADLRELDDATLTRADLVAVETRASALEEAGDVVQAAAAGVLAPTDLVELRDVVRGTARRGAGDGITVFKSVGLALEDLAVARAAAG